MLSKEGLIERMTAYMEAVDTDRVGAAYDFLLKAHDGQYRDSGEPYASHPVAVGAILTEIQSDQDTIIAGLLHDTVEDTVATTDDLVTLFGSTVAEIVDGVTKLTDLEVKDSPHEKREGNLRKLVVSMNRDLRVLIVKLADRLHNMRTLEFKKNPESRRRSAEESLNIYSTFANYAGLNRWKAELQDLAFKELYPNEYRGISMALEAMNDASDDIIPLIRERFKTQLEAKGINARIVGRMKTPFSTWMKLKVKNISLEDLSDIIAFRLIVPDADTCYRALGVIHQSFRLIGDSAFTDYISNPKPNGYRGLHTEIYTKLAPEENLASRSQGLRKNDPKGTTGSAATQEGLRVEVQIRSESMHQHAELGDASHWLYKAEKHSLPAPLAEGPLATQRRIYLQGLLTELVEYNQDRDSYLKSLGRESADKITVFTPMGKPVFMANGSTLLDFAFSVHTDLGARAVGARLDGRDRPLNTKLTVSGHQVEIITSPDIRVTEVWLSWVTTNRATTIIRRILSHKKRETLIAKARLALEQLFEEHACELTPKGLAAAAERLGIDADHSDDLLEYVGRWVEAIGNRQPRHLLTRERKFIDPQAVFSALYPQMGEGNKSSNRTQIRSTQASRSQVQAADSPKSLFRLNVVGSDTITDTAIFNFSRCCSPLPPEDIIGFLTTDTQISVHRRDCLALANLERMTDRWLDVRWSDQARQASYSVRLRAELINKPGALSKLAEVIANANSNIVDLKFRERYPTTFITDLEIEVTDVRHYYHILSALQILENVADIKRL